MNDTTFTLFIYRFYLTSQRKLDYFLCQFHQLYLEVHIWYYLKSLKSTFFVTVIP